MARAASMKSFSRSAITSARTTRVYRSQPVRPSTTMMVTRLGPSAATNASASRICGNDSVTSTTVTMTVSTLPPTNPLTSPSGHADEQAHDHGRDADQQRDARAVDDPAEDVAADLVRAERIGGVTALLPTPAA